MFCLKGTSLIDDYPLSLHDALPIYRVAHVFQAAEDVLDVGVIAERNRHQARSRRVGARRLRELEDAGGGERADRKSTRLNSSHLVISYAVFCLKKKRKHHQLLVVLN